MDDINREKEHAALVSVAVKVVLTLAKFVAALFSGSLALLSEAGNNLGDVGVTLMSYFAIRMAAKPADEHAAASRNRRRTVRHKRHDQAKRRAPADIPDCRRG